MAVVCLQISIGRIYTQMTMVGENTQKLLMLFLFEIKLWERKCNIELSQARLMAYVSPKSLPRNQHWALTGKINVTSTLGVREGIGDEALMLAEEAERRLCSSRMTILHQHSQREVLWSQEKKESRVDDNGFRTCWELGGMVYVGQVMMVSECGPPFMKVWRKNCTRPWISSLRQETMAVSEE